MAIRTNGSLIRFCTGFNFRGHLFIKGLSCSKHTGWPVSTTRFDAFSSDMFPVLPHSYSLLLFSQSQDYDRFFNHF